MQITIPHNPYQQYPLQTPPLTATIVTDTTTTATVPRSADEQPSLIVTETSTVSLGPSPDAAHLLNAPPQTIETYTPVPRGTVKKTCRLKCKQKYMLYKYNLLFMLGNLWEFGRGGLRFNRILS